MATQQQPHLGPASQDGFAQAEREIREASDALDRARGLLAEAVRTNSGLVPPMVARRGLDVDILTKRLAAAVERRRALARARGTSHRSPRQRHLQALNIRMAEALGHTLERHDIPLADREHPTTAVSIVVAKDDGRGTYRKPLPNYAGDAAACAIVRAHLEGRGYLLETGQQVHEDGRPWFALWWHPDDPGRSAARVGGAPSMEAAITMAALQALGGV